MLILKANAKINLTLDVLYKRPDGYHEVLMVMQAIDLADTVALRPQKEGITLSVDTAELPADRTNLAYRAAALVRERFSISRGVHIDLAKRIPLAAGLAGGSADAAAVLKGLNELWSLGLGEAELEELAASLGSDVPFCLYGGTMLASGRGEKLAPLPDLPSCHVVLAKPAFSVSTAWAYGNFRPEEAVCRPDTNGVIKALERGELAAVAGGLCNVLESVTMRQYPEIGDLKNHMLELGAMASLMSGSGPTVFGLAEDSRQAEYIAAGLRRRTGAQVIVAQTATRVGR